MKHFFEFVVFSMILLKSSTYLFSLFFRKCTHFWSFDVECSVSVSRLSICSCFTTKHGRFGTVGILLANWWNFCRLWMGVKLCVRHNDLDGSKYLQWQRISKLWEKPCKNVCIKIKIKNSSKISMHLLRTFIHWAKHSQCVWQFNVNGWSRASLKCDWHFANVPVYIWSIIG